MTGSDTMRSMQEIELKFQVPEESLAALQAALVQLPGGSRNPQHLAAAYFDTTDRKLAKARAALRIRQEDDACVQTLKAAGPNAMSRLEDNQPASAGGGQSPQMPNLSLHQGAAREALIRDLGWQPQQDPHGENCGLIALYRTNMRRTRAQINSVELALDLGTIEAGTRQVPVRELEIELIEGSPQAVIDAARALVQEHGLWLDSQTKAHRGDQLAREEQLGHTSPHPPAQIRTKRRADDSPRGEWLRAWNNALEQVSMNLSEVAIGGDKRPWVRAAVVGLRRLKRLSQLAVAPSLDEGWSTQLDAIIQTLRPSANKLASPELATALSRAPSTTLWQLDALALLVSD